jgi:malonyl-CoA/methylmalonyl-CoA synthetase
MLFETALTKDSCRKMRVFISGSAPLSEQTFLDFKKRTGHEIVERYGMTETGMNTSNPLQGLRKLGSVGIPLQGVQVRTRNESGYISAESEPGEVEVKGQNVFEGYWKREDYRSIDFTKDGFFRTGDLGHIDREGYLFLIGRKKDLIISGGLNVFPKEIELMIDSFAEVKESAVIGLPHPDFGEQVVAVIVTEETARLDKPTLINKMKNKIASFKIPKEVFFVDELPRNAMGKVQKNILRETLS